MTGLRAALAAALRRAALPDAVSVVYRQEPTDEGRAVHLASLNASGAPLPDGRDYKLLKASFKQVEAASFALAAAVGEDPEGFVRARLDLTDSRLTVDWRA